MQRQPIQPFPSRRPWRGGALFLPALERLQNLYPQAYARGSTSTHEGVDNKNLDVKVSVRTHPGAAGFHSILGGGDPYPTRPSLLVGTTIDEFPVTQKSWLDRGSAYGAKVQLNYQHWQVRRMFWSEGQGEKALG